MGRPDTGALTVNQCSQLTIKSFREHLNTKGTFKGVSTWKSGASISFILYNTEQEITLELLYTKTDNEGQKHKICYKVPIVSMPSNLGKGVVYYFVCPFGGKRCKVLYMGYGSHYFKSRQAYRNRIYYASQLSSHLDRHTDQYWRLEREVEKLTKKQRKTHYKGQKTTLQQRIERLIEERNYHEEMRWVVVPKAVAKFMGAKGVKSARFFM